MIRWDKIKSRFALLAGIIGLVADMITILGTIGVSQILPSTSNMRIVSGALDSLILITALVGLYSVTMIVWFLFRWQRTGQEIKTFGFDEVFADPEGLTYLIPVIGAIAGLIAYTSVRVVFWLAVFISLLPTSLWLYLNTGQIWLGCFAGLLGSFILAQYATFFALVLDKFFESGNL